MKKIILVIAFLLVGLGSYAQSVDVRVRSRDGRVKMHFGHSHDYMVKHGYRYHHHGYYHRHGVKVYPRYRTYHGNVHHGWSRPVYHRKHYYHRSRGHHRGRGHR